MLDHRIPHTGRTLSPGKPNLQQLPRASPEAKLVLGHLVKLSVEERAWVVMEISDGIVRHPTTLKANT